MKHIYGITEEKLFKEGFEFMDSRGIKEVLERAYNKGGYSFVFDHVDGEVAIRPFNKKANPNYEYCGPCNSMSDLKHLCELLKIK